MMIPPAFVMVAGAVLLPFLPKKIRSAAFVFVTFCTLALVLNLPDGSSSPVKVMNYSLVLCEVDDLSRVFGIIFAFIAFAGGIYAFHIKETGQQVAALLYAGGALGVTFAGDFFTLFIYWEMMAVASAYLIWARRTKESHGAGFRYLLYHVLGGGLLFAGILLHISKPGTDIFITDMNPGMGISAWLMLLGVVINAAVPPLHSWLSDAYPKATVTGAVFLSAFTTKTAVYVLARMFHGWEVLLIFGTIMTLYGVIFAVLANDIRGILAYHIISQVGYMVAGVGIGTAMAINGAVSHAFSHILYKALLFMGAGVVLHTTGTSKLTELGGLGKKQPITFWLYMIAAFSISGFPLFNGFISKSMTVAAAISGEAHYEWAHLLMILAAVGTFLSVGLKLPYFTWYSREKPKELKPTAPPKNMHIGMAVVAFFCILHGIAPKLLYVWLPHLVKWNPFTMHHLVETVQILVFTFVVFWLMRKVIHPKARIALDLDWFYRKPAKLVRRIIVEPWNSSFDWVEGQAFTIAGKLATFGKNPFLLFSRDKSDGTYTPDRYRPAAQQLVFAVLGLFIIVVFLGLIL
ncbi:MAG: Na(+)/H(+) antiporter subunit D [Candidatus Aminicenantes bacterium]|nr:Na(+)/H(+) antiporter subunit D [Candidatus Aminicenantes bacterium]NIM83839.1 Na(+)/H(+) antiporter subunit D [Candidatus Aminicenantes bacterium]NIN23303.1 Na(+)/H(+) antiporter subunit D [Candidatus Aminicenantes bacterium]NIN47007.1 Na(+)/H(+) antiporter subunit D [Candidatus Aminicenantes bacterium]NIN89929.1 Na(+)/H(+) antiporter subunit D [Candidatus Aminicenantes bacterium]